MAHADNRHMVRVAVFAVVEKDGQILLTKRANTGYKDGWYTMPSGHLEDGETVQEAAVRELREETGLEASAADTEVALVCHNKGDLEYFNFYLVVKKWSGEPANTEPGKCSEVAWYPRDQLPENTIDYVRDALERIGRGEQYSNWAWKTSGT